MRIYYTCITFLVSQSFAIAKNYKISWPTVINKGKWKSQNGRFQEMTGFGSKLIAKLNLTLTIADLWFAAADHVLLANNPTVCSYKTSLFMHTYHSLGGSG